ncbi:hypothetical protein [Dyella sp. C9]|uniref:hypothetical protein n=1 Tax=Dyella sp. C9 TaxID=2202154 RepID=UPI000DEED604|nr:hypothetical protein [Dyella sp. C9]
MKRTIAMLAITAVLAGCGNKHTIATDPNEVAKKWNADVPQPELRLEAVGGPNILRTGTGIWVTYYPSEHSWMAMASVASGTPACTELLVATTGMSQQQARELFNRLSDDNHWVVQDGNLEFSFNPMGGVICRVTDTSRH